jgi:hypothetical protein
MTASHGSIGCHSTSKPLRGVLPGSLQATAGLAFTASEAAGLLFTLMVAMRTHCCSTKTCPEARAPACHLAARGRVRTDTEGRYNVRSIQPVPYQIPHHGPTGALLDAMGRHSWRPAHIHYKISHPGMHTHISQAYFEGGAYVGDDCCEDRCEGHVVAEVYDNGARVIEVDFCIAPERVATTAV